MKMNKEYKTSYRLFGIWQEEKEMEWLRQMSLQGWHLVSAAVVVYTFEKGEAKDLSYYGDYKSFKQWDLEEYLHIFQDAGWTFICKQGNWFYFSSPVDNKYREVYSNNQSRLEKFRLLLLLHIFLLPMLTNSMLIVSRRMMENASVPMGILLLIVATFLITAVYSAIRVIIQVSKLSKAASE